MRKLIFICCSMIFLFGIVSCGKKEAVEAPKGKTLLEYGGQASVKIISKDGVVIYVDPYSGDYSEKADILLVTHEHYDHNEVNKVNLKDNAKVIRIADALVDKKYSTFEEKGIKIKAVSAYNKNHKEETSVGYIIEVDGFKIYHAGDTNGTSEMSKFKEMSIDYALLPYDGEYNMGPDEMASVAKLINARYVIPIHGLNQDPSKINLDNLKILKTRERIELIK